MWFFGEMLKYRYCAECTKRGFLAIWMDVMSVLYSNLYRVCFSFFSFFLGVDVINEGMF